MRIQLALHPDSLLNDDALREAARRKLGVEPRALRLEKRSIDARKGRVRIHATLAIDEPEPPPPSPPALPTLQGEAPVVIVGAGPAGLFCAWELAQSGVRAIVVDRGKPVQARRRDLAALTTRGELNPESNYCFGEGGAGTFSDGKLYTRSSKRGDAERVLRALVAYGAPGSILVDARPHIGTNRLPKVITVMREHLESAGVTLLFGTRVDELETRSSQVAGVKTHSGCSIPARAIVLAAGHSARDVPRFARAAGAEVSFKPFALGVRVEHAQSLIDRLQFGAFAGHPALGAASYRIVERSGDSAAFSFCMCPGGFIAPAATEPGGQVVNGWSPSKRNGRFANSGFVTEVSASELRQHGLDPTDPFAGVTLQRRIEQAAFAAGGGDYGAPGQLISDFLEGRLSRKLPTTSYPRPVRSADLAQVLGRFAIPLGEALRRVERKMPGYAREDAVMVGVETRTSSPVRIERDRDSLEARGVGGLYPCAEGAGFAGGIMSAALDGIRVARSIVSSLDG